MSREKLIDDLKKYFSVFALEKKDHEELMNLYIEYVVLAEDYV
jgi:hypothetical protein